MDTPDPEKVMQALSHLRDAFKTAADNSTGAAQPLFQRLSDSFNKVVNEGMMVAEDTQDMNAVMQKMMPTLIELNMTLAQIKRIAQRDADTAKTMSDLEKTIRSEMENIMDGSMGGGMSRQKPNDMTPPTQNPRQRKPKGKFDL